MVVEAGSVSPTAMDAVLIITASSQTLKRADAGA